MPSLRFLASFFLSVIFWIVSPLFDKELLARQVVGIDHPWWALFATRNNPTAISKEVADYIELTGEVGGINTHYLHRLWRRGIDEHVSRAAAACVRSSDPPTRSLGWYGLYLCGDQDRTNAPDHPRAVLKRAIAGSLEDHDAFYQIPLAIAALSLAPSEADIALIERCLHTKSRGRCQNSAS